VIAVLKTITAKLSTHFLNGTAWNDSP